MEDWKNPQDIKGLLDEELRGIKANEGNLAKIMQRVENEQFDEGDNMDNNGKKRAKSLKTVVKVSLIAAAIAVMSVCTVLGIIKSKYEQESIGKYIDHFDGAENDAPVYEIKDNNAVADNIVVEWGKYTTTSHELYLQLTVKSKDGSPIMTEKDNSVPFRTGTALETVYVTVDGDRKRFMRVHKVGEDDSTLLHTGKFDGGEGIIGVGCNWYVASAADDLSSITFEIQYQNYDVDLHGKEIEFELEDINLTYLNFEEVCGQTTLAQLLEGATAGVDKIYFSDKYPGSYIDNFGFVNNGSINNFVMTIVCDEASKNELKELTFQSTITGLNVLYDSKELEDGRIELTYSANFDRGHYETVDGRHLATDTEWKHLESIILKKGVDNDIVALLDGSVGTTFTIEEEVREVDADCEVVVPAVDNQTSPVTITNLKFDGINMTIKGKIESDFDFMKFGLGVSDHPICIMKDGTQIIMKSNGGGGNTSTGFFEYYFKFPDVVNIDNITKIEWHGVTIWQRSR